jgi:hypothetical protein
MITKVAAAPAGKLATFMPPKGTLGPLEKDSHAELKLSPALFGRVLTKSAVS